VEVAIVIAAIVAVGLVGGAGIVAWPLYFKPRLRRRYERKHHRNKIAADRSSAR
jgi:hypothetical protein